jgi:hypothetical protein
MSHAFYREPGQKLNGWIRWGRWVFEIKSHRPLFSERNGYTRYLKIGFGYRIRLSRDNHAHHQ